MSQHSLSQLKSFLEVHVRDQAMEWDHTGTFPTEVFAALHKMGVLKMGVPTKWGGLGSSMPELLDLTTTLAEFSPGMVSSLMGNLAAQTALYRFAPENRHAGGFRYSVFC